MDGNREHRDIWAYAILGVQVWQLILSVFLYIGIFQIAKYQLAFGKIPSDLKLLSFLSFLAGASGLLGMVYIFLVIRDLIQLNREGNPVTGLILFAVLLKPAYYAYRCHVLGRKMKNAIWYTAAYYACSFGVALWVFYQYYRVILSAA